VPTNWIIIIIIIIIVDSFIFVTIDQRSKWAEAGFVKITFKDLSTAVAGQCGSSSEARMFVNDS